MRRAVIWAVLAVAACARAPEPERLLLGATHTLEDSGLLPVLAESFAADVAGHRLSIVVAGSGEVLTMAARGDLDVVLAHSPDDEIALVASGRARSRDAVMHNDFVVLGPLADPAGVAGSPTAAAALARIEDGGAVFVSRGDGSGTHRRELALWAAAQRIPDWTGYTQAGTGMADALRIAAQRGAYTLADRATFEMLRDGLPLTILFEGGSDMRNQYSVLVVANARNVAGAERFAEWIRGELVQQMIADYGRDRTGRSLFVPDALEPKSRR